MHGQPPDPSDPPALASPGTAPFGTAACMAWGVLGGTGLHLQQARLGWWGGHAVLVAAGLALVWVVLLGRRRAFARSGHRRARWMGLCLLAVAGAGCGAGLAGWRAAVSATHALAPGLEGQPLRVTGMVSAMVQPMEGGQRIRLAVEAAEDAQGQPVVLPPLVELAWYAAPRWPGAGDDAAGPAAAAAATGLVRPGERWRFDVRLKAPHGLRNPHGFDTELWLWTQGVQATGTVRGDARAAPPQRLDRTWRHPVEQARQAVRDAIVQRLAPPVAGQVHAAGVVAALVTGDQAAIERGDWDVFRATGVAHLMAISGLHITMFCWLAGGAIAWAWRRSARLCLAWPAPHAGGAGGLAAALAYAVFSGWGVPAQRTAVMLAWVVTLRLSGRRWPWPHLLLAAAVAVVLADPWAPLQAGFWLSFVAVGVLFATGEDTPAGTVGWRQRLRGHLRTQGVVTVALAPLSLALFGQMSVVGLLANLLAIPWVTLVVTPLALLGVLVPPLWDVAAWAVMLLGRPLYAAAAWPGATLSLPAAPTWAVLASILGGTVLCLRLPWSLRACGLPLLLPALLWQPPRPSHGMFTVLAADVGQGAAVLVRTARHALLYDTGPRYLGGSDAGQRVLRPLLQALGVRLDMLVVSHRDTDHAGGMAAIRAHAPQAEVLASFAVPAAGAGPAPAGGTAGRLCLAGQRWHWDGVDFEILHPAPGHYREGASANSVSCVLRITSASGRVALLTGDIGVAEERGLLAAHGSGLRADWLLVPHHGSLTSSSPAFVQAVAPYWALAQAGYRHRFGHPAPAVVQRYRDAGALLVDSAHCGAALWSSALPKSLGCERLQRPRYWQHGLPSQVPADARP